MRDEDFRFQERRPDTWVGAAAALAALRSGDGEPKHYHCSLVGKAQIHTQRGGSYVGGHVATGLNEAGRVASRSISADTDA